jgi:hypothetical protein
LSSDIFLFATENTKHKLYFYFPLKLSERFFFSHTKFFLRNVKLLLLKHISERGKKNIKISVTKAKGLENIKDAVLCTVSFWREKDSSAIRISEKG